MLRYIPIHLLLGASLFYVGAMRRTESTVAKATPLFDNTLVSATASSQDPHPILVELFTSEGCSSCPPADALLLNMDASQPVPGAQLVVLSEHVDYWDHDGWKDPNSSHALTERQAQYVRAFGLKTAYTPQIIVDGTGEMLMNNPEETMKVFQNALATPDIPVHIGDVTVDPANPSILRAHVDIDGKADTKDAHVYAVVALSRVESHVLRGENKSRHLTHVAVVQELTKVGSLPKGKNFAEDVQLKVKAGTDLKNLRVVVFVQEAGPGKVLGVDMRKPAA